VAVSNSSDNVPVRDESKGLKLFIAVSLGAHFLGFILSYFNLLSLPKPPLEEWSIDTELVSDLDVGSSPKTVIPRAQISEEVSVPSNQLPQLTKTVSIKEKVKEEEGVAEEKKEEKIETGKNVTKDTDDDGQTIVKPDAAVKLKKSEALERLVREKLKDEQKKETRELKAQDNSDLAQIRDILKDAGLTQNTGGLSGVAARNRYQSYLFSAIKRNYALPKTYEISNPNLQAQLVISISARGELMRADIETSSGDSVFDDACITSVQKSSPFNPPPDFLAGEPIKIFCKP
jgi:colicin import membrane protein